MCIRDRIYYDTDNISENQEIRQRLCGNCGSYRVIDSTAIHAGGNRYRVLCFSIPLYSCRNCREEARAAYCDSLEKGGFDYDYIYLQDRAADDYRRFDCSFFPAVRAAVKGYAETCLLYTSF